VTPEKITTRYRMNSLNKPKVEIDRRTGAPAHRQHQDRRHRKVQG
jgi:hypothetical protein